MTLEDLVHHVESRLVSLGRRLWRPDPRAELWDELDRNEVRLGQRRRDLAAAEGQEASVRGRVLDRRAAADLLAARVEAAWAARQADWAWRLALELDRVRRELSADEMRLASQERVTWSLGFAVRQLERECTRLQRRCGA
jgi:hypothetical protein